MVQINKEVVAEILQKTPTAEAFAEYAANRKRPARNGVSPLSAIRTQMESEGYLAVPEDLLLMFRELERAGAGKLEKKLGKAWFKWYLPMKEIGEALRGPRSSDKPAEPVPAETKTASSASAKVLFVSFGPSKDIKISIPSDLTNTEVEYLCSKILQECG